MTDAVMIAAFVTGLVLLAAGAWMAWPPAGLLLAGAVLVLVPLLWARGSDALSSRRREG